jgi:hypothetical protein
MKSYIYGLIDPHDYKVRYVGRTSQRMDKRLAHHIGQANRGNPRPIYSWIRSLTVSPWLVCLETCDGLVKKVRGGWRNASAPAEVKWIKRFRRDCLNDVVCEERKGDWTRLVNPSTSKESES